MKSNLKQLASHYGVSYKALRDVASNLPSSVIELGKRGCTILDIEEFERAIAELPKKQIESVSIQKIEPDDSNIIEAEIVEEEVDVLSSQLNNSLKGNFTSLKEVAKLAAIQHGKEIANTYRKHLVKSASQGINKAQVDISGLLGK